MNSQEAFRVLGLSPGAGADEVKRAYRRKALECHPDRAQDESQKSLYEQRFKEAREAYARLRDEEADLPDETEVVPEMSSWVAGRTFAPGEVEAVSHAEKLGLRSPFSLETALLWLGGAAALTVLIYVLRFLVEVIRGGGGE